jgi:hypothetical protein
MAARGTTDGAQMISTESTYALMTHAIKCMAVKAVSTCISRSNTTEATKPTGKK